MKTVMATLGIAVALTGCQDEAAQNSRLRPQPTASPAQSAAECELSQLHSFDYVTDALTGPEAVVRLDEELGEGWWYDAELEQIALIDAVLTYFAEVANSGDVGWAWDRAYFNIEAQCVAAYGTAEEELELQEKALRHDCRARQKEGRGMSPEMREECEGVLP